MGKSTMKPENFCYWLQGFFELSQTETLSKDQVDQIKSHMKLVFEKVTPELPKKVDHTDLNKFIRDNQKTGDGGYTPLEVPFEEYLSSIKGNGYKLPPEMPLEDWMYQWKDGRELIC